MTRDAIAFLDAMGFGQADLLGFSIGSFVSPGVCLRWLARNFWSVASADRLRC